ncbi:MAG: VOC family protein [Aeromicrobium sp.]
MSRRLPGVPCWFELGGSSDGEVLEFWSHTLGWVMDENRQVAGYRRSHAGGMKVAGFGGPVEPVVQRGWRVYLSVDDLDATLVSATAAGAVRIGDIVQAGPDGRFAWIRDPHGLSTGFFEPTDDPGTSRESGPGRVSGWTIESPVPAGTAAFYTSLFPGFDQHVIVSAAATSQWIVSVSSGPNGTTGDVADPRGNVLRLEAGPDTVVEG